MNEMRLFFVWHIAKHFSFNRGGFRVLSRLRGHAGGARVHLRPKFSAPAELLGARGQGVRPESRELRSTHGIAFPDAEPPRTMENPPCQVFSAAAAAAAVVAAV